MLRSTGSLATFALAVLALLVVVATYVLSAAPLLRLADADSTVASEGAPRAWDVFYRPLTRMMQSPVLRGPLIRWFDVWVSRETRTAAVDGWLVVPGSGGTVMSFSLIISSGFRFDHAEDDEEAAVAEIVPGDADWESE